MFLQDLQNSLYDFDLDQYDPNISWQIWKNKFFRIWNKYAPVKTSVTTDLIHLKRHIKLGQPTQLMHGLSTKRQKTNTIGK